MRGGMGLTVHGGAEFGGWGWHVERQRRWESGWAAFWGSWGIRRADGRRANGGVDSRVKIGEGWGWAGGFQGRRGTEVGEGHVR